MSNTNNSETNNTNKSCSSRCRRKRGRFWRWRRSAHDAWRKTRDFKGSMTQLIRYLGKYRSLIVIVLIVAAGSTVFTILGPRTLGKATTALYEGVRRMILGQGGIDFNEVG